MSTRRWPEPRSRWARSGPPLVVAHRGASLVEPENTLAAMARAVEDGADALEVDVRLSRDRQAVCVHDATVDRTSDGTGKVSSLSLADLQRLDFGGQGVLTLRELMAFVGRASRPVGVLVETKHPSRWLWQVERAVVAELRHALGPDLTGLPVLGAMSFSPIAVRRFAGLAPELHRTRLRSYRALIPQLSTSHSTGLDLRLVLERPDVVADCHRRGQRAFVWTVNDPDDIRFCVDLGVDAIITDDPATARTVTG